jgi:hypothetical protein
VVPAVAPGDGHARRAQGGEQAADEAHEPREHPREATAAYIVFMAPNTGPTPMTKATNAARPLRMIASGPA